MPAERFVGTVEGGKVRLDHVPRWKAAMSVFEGQRVEITIQRYRENRSLKANAYLWGVVYKAIAEWSGHEVDEIHDAMKVLHLAPKDVTMPTGELVKALGSTRTLNTEQFAEYVSKVKLWAGEQGLHVPEPDEVGDL